MVSIINTYFEAMSAAITKHKGLVLQFIGDEIEAVFGAPAAIDNHQESAINSAIEMRERLSELNLTLSNKDIHSSAMLSDCMQTNLLRPISAALNGSPMPWLERQ